MRYDPRIGSFWDILIILLVVYVQNVLGCAAISSQELKFLKNKITHHYCLLSSVLRRGVNIFLIMYLVGDIRATIC